MGLRKRLSIRGTDYMERAIETKNAEIEAAKKIPKERYMAAAELTQRLVAELGIYGAMKAQAKLGKRLTDIMRTEGNRPMSEEEFASVRDGVVNEIIAKKKDREG